MPNRRTFMHQLAGGAACIAASGIVVPRSALGANDRIRFGLIGAGDRGKEIFGVALRCPNVEAVAVADIYPRRLDDVRSLAPSIKTFRDYRRLLEDKSIDAVLIATPQHQHALNFVAAIESGKDVYQEKTMASNPGHAKRSAQGVYRLRSSGASRHADEQAPSIGKIQELLAAGRLGTITAIQAHHYRNCALRRLAPEGSARLRCRACRLARLRGRGSAPFLRSPALH